MATRVERGEERGKNLVKRAISSASELAGNVSLHGRLRFDALTSATFALR
jgi:hypothetical protein